MLEKEILELSKFLGADLCGFCCLDDNICRDFPTLKFAVSIAIKLSDTVLKTIKTEPSIMYFQHYRTANTKLDLISFDIVKFIEQQGYSALPIAASQSLNTNKDEYSAVFSHKLAAIKANIGYIGKNCLLITPQYGSKIRLATILTDMPLTALNEKTTKDCGDCLICCKSCPAGAISGNNYRYDGNRDYIFSADKCSRYMKDKFQNIGRGSVCGICIKVCPKNKLQ